PEALGRVSHELLRTVHPGGASAFEATLDCNGRWEGELIHTTRDGRKLAVESRHVVVSDGAGPALVLEVNRDLTERRRADEALRRSEGRLRRLWESNIIGVMYADAEGNITGANDAVLGMLGFAREDLAAGLVRWRDMTLPEHRSLDEAAIAESL